MNLYDKKIIKCIKCKNPIGEMELESKIVFSICNKCHLKNSDRTIFAKNEESAYDFLNKRMIETVRT